MSKYREIFKEAYKEVTLKEWDDENDQMYGSNNSGEVNWTLNLPMNKELADIFINNGLVEQEDLYTNGQLNPTFEYDCKIEYDYSIDSYSKEEDDFWIEKIYINTFNNGKDTWVDITNLLPKDYIYKVTEELAYKNPMNR